MRVDKKYLLSVLLIVIMVAMAYFPLLKNINSMITSDNDWSFYTFYASAYRTSVLEYKQLPIRTHLLAGGYPLIAHPRDWSLNPLAFLILIFGEIAGLKLSMFILFLLGGLGMFYLAKNVLGYNYLGALFSSFLYIFSSWGAYHTVQANFSVLLSYMLPWVIAFYLKSIHKRKFIIYASLALAMVITLGSLLVIPTIIFFFIFSLMKSLSIQKRLRLRFNSGYLKNFTMIVLCAVLLCSVKILPMVGLLNSRTDVYFHGAGEETTYDTIDRNHFFTSEKLIKSIFDKGYQHRLKIYFGYIPIVFFLLALCFYGKKMFSFFFPFIFFTIVMFGPYSHLDLYRLLWNLHPFIRAIVEQDRYFLPFVIFPVALISGSVFLLLKRLTRFRPFWAIAVGILIIYSFFDTFFVQQNIMKRIVYKPVPNTASFIRSPESFFQIAFDDPIQDIEEEKGELSVCSSSNSPKPCRPQDYVLIKDYTKIFPLIRQNIGVVTFCGYAESLDIAESAIPKYIINKNNYYEPFSNIHQFRSIADKLAVNPNYRGEAFALGKDNKIEIVSLGPTRIEINANFLTPDTLIINQNYHRSWKSNTGLIANHQGLLAVDLPEGRHDIVLRYVPLDFYLGAAISLLALLGIGGYIIFLKNEQDGE
ncbi:MAG: hypothetical protein K9L86_00485 [Candidatus Omnitrophica bacterium]|nr:hypothetical protein [Candidatus Omnitrophota bacterium]